MRVLAFYFFTWIISITLNVFNCGGQPTTFIKSFNTGNSGYVVRETRSSNYIVAGGTDFYYNFHWFTMSGIPSTNIHLLKTNQDGSLIWEKVFGKPGARTIGMWMEITNDSGTIITGHMNRDLVWPPDSNDIVLMKTDENGNLSWAKQFDTGKDELGFCVRQTFDSGYILAGFHDDLPMSLVGNTYALLIKTDAIGNIQWEKKYQLAVRDLDTGEGLPWYVRQTADSGYVLVGTTADLHAADVYVIRTNSSGDVLWANSYDHDNSALRFSLGLDIIESLSGDLIIAGSMDKDQTLNQYNYPYILKLNSSGQILDYRFYDSAPAQMFQSGFSSVEQTPDGGFFFTGMGGYGGFGMQAQLLKTDQNFNMQWSRAYTNDINATVGSRSGRMTNDGCYIFTGKKLNQGTILWKADMFGLVPCKNPGILVEMSPSVIRHNLSPLAFTGINSSNLAFSVLPTLSDTETVCPVTTAVLPVELLSFTAELIPENKIRIDWQTASEIDCDYFIVYRSTDGIEFSELQKIQGAGNSTKLSSYSIVDENIYNSKIIYYRLDQVDYNGNNHSSKVIPVALKPEDLSIISVYADYNLDQIKILLQSNCRNMLHFTITDAVGKVILRQNNPSGIGFNATCLSSYGLSKGIYFLEVNDGEKSQIRKFIY